MEKCLDWLSGLSCAALLMFFLFQQPEPLQSKRPTVQRYQSTSLQQTMIVGDERVDACLVTILITGFDEEKHLVRIPLLLHPGDTEQVQWRTFASLPVHCNDEGVALLQLWRN